MTDEVYRWSVREKLIEPGDFVLAGVSGGADSVCLLLLLLELRGRMEFSLEIIHVEHGIRGEESRQDAAFVEQLCEEYNVPCHICAVDVPAYAAEHSVGLEEAARTLRYEEYRSVAENIMRQRSGAGRRRVRIALAHHADDNAETVLFQMIRGSGLRGLGGMRVKRELSENVTVIRPLLFTERKQIEQYLKEKGQEYRTDRTNFDTDYSRNRMRHVVFQALAEINPRAVAHITKSAGLLCEVADYLERETECLLTKVSRCIPGDCRISLALFQNYPPFLQRAAVIRILGEAAGSSRDIGSVHVEAVCDLADRQVGRMIDLPYGMTAERTYEGIRIRRKENEDAPERRSSRRREHLPAPEDGRSGLEESYEISAELLLQAESEQEICKSLPDGEICLRVQDFSGEMREIPKKTYTKWFDYDKIKHSLCLRRRTAGDYLTIDEMGHKKKLKEYFIEAKIPQEQRGKIWLLAENSHIVWIIGERISADYKVCEDTERILEVRMSGGKYRED